MLARGAIQIAVFLFLATMSLSYHAFVSWSTMANYPQHPSNIYTYRHRTPAFTYSRHRRVLFWFRIERWAGRLLFMRVRISINIPPPTAPKLTKEETCSRKINPIGLLRLVAQDPRPRIPAQSLLLLVGIVIVPRHSRLTNKWCVL